MFDPPMWKAFQRYREQDTEARKLFWRAATLLPIVAVSLRVRGFGKTKGWLGSKASPPPVDASRPGASVETLQRTCRMVRAGAQYGLGRPTCLEQSLVLWYLLQSQQIAVRFRIGVRKVAGKFEAHAWVEHEGTALNQIEEVHQHYAAFEGEFADMPEEIA